MEFELLKKATDCKARAGRINTEHGELSTPVFMPVGTGGTVKAVHQRELKDDLHAQIILGNTYHLYLRPGAEIIHQAGGIHRFMNWEKPVLTDSGGYQVFSLAHRRKISAEGALFSSHIDGSRHHFTPENIVDIQRLIGADIMMVLDECTAYPADHKTAKKSVDLTHQWLQRGMEQFEKTSPLYGYEQAFLPIVQGSIFHDLRTASAREACQYPSPGYAIGGLSVGEPETQMYEIVDLVTDILPREKVRYLMGVGSPANLLEAISLGIDMFDCVMPTRNGRNGMLFTRKGIINIKNNKWKNDYSPVDPEGICFADHQYSKAYLRHLVISNEILGAQIASLHNLSFYLWIMKEARNRIMEGDFYSWKNEMVHCVSKRL